MLGGGTSDFWYDVPNIYTGYSNVNFNLARGWVRALLVAGHGLFAATTLLLALLAAIGTGAG